MYARQDRVQFTGSQPRSDVLVLACLESHLQFVLIGGNQCGQLRWRSLPKPSIENLWCDRFDGCGRLRRLSLCGKHSTAAVDLCRKLGALREPADVLVIFAGVSSEEVDIVIRQPIERYIRAIRSLTLQQRLDRGYDSFKLRKFCVGIGKLKIDDGDRRSVKEGRT